MMSSLRTQSSRRGLEQRPAKALVPLAALFASLTVAGCSADVTRFDFPIFSMNEPADATASLPPPSPYASGAGAPSAGYGTTPEPVAPSYDTSPDYGGYGGYGGERARGAVERRPDLRRPDPYGGGRSRAPMSAPMSAPYGVGAADRDAARSEAARANGRSGGSGGAQRSTGFPTAPGYDTKPVGAPVGTSGGRDIAAGETASDPVGGAPDNYGASGADATRTVTVESGDTLYSLSRRYGVSVSALMDANGLTSPMIRIGQKLRIPAPARSVVARRGVRARMPSRASTMASENRETRARGRAAGTPAADEAAEVPGDGYRVRPGDSLYKIARRHGVTVAALKRENGIDDPTKLRVGQVITIPAPAATASRAGFGAGPGPVSLPEGGNRLGDTPTTAPTRTARLDDGSRPRGDDEPRRATERRPIGGSAKALGLGGPTDIDDEAFDEGKFRWPVKGRIISPFGSRADGTRNDGINIAVPPGTVVRAVEDGVVAYAGDELKGYGNLILIRHSDQWVSAYAHNREILVKRGDRVRRGQVIAKSGLSGSVDRPQLHFELRKGSKPVDPLKYLASR